MKHENKVMRNEDEGRRGVGGWGGSSDHQATPSSAAAASASHIRPPPSSHLFGKLMMVWRRSDFKHCQNHKEGFAIATDGVSLGASRFTTRFRMTPSRGRALQKKEGGRRWNCIRRKDNFRLPNP